MTKQKAHRAGTRACRGPSMYESSNLLLRRGCRRLGAQPCRHAAKCPHIHTYRTRSPPACSQVNGQSLADLGRAISCHKSSLSACGRGLPGRKRRRSISAYPNKQFPLTDRVRPWSRPHSQTHAAEAKSMECVVQVGSIDNAARYMIVY